MPFSCSHFNTFEALLVTTFEALLRKCLFSFVTRRMQSKNILMSSLMSSDVFYQSEFFRHYKATLK